MHGAYISEQETTELVDFLKKQGAAVYDESVLEQVEEDSLLGANGAEDDYDDRYDEAVSFVCEAGQASITAFDAIHDQAKPREVLARKSYE